MRLGVLTTRQLARCARTIEDMDPGILDSHRGHRGLIATNPGSLRKHSYIVMLLTSSSKQFRLRQLGAFQVPKDRFV
jgi:hypothetical protein